MLMLYRRSFTLDAPMKDAVLVVDGMGVRAKFELDGKDLGLHPYPYARLEIPVGPLAAGEHEIVAAVDNILSWPRVKLARPYYDFYFYGGFYRGAHYQQSERFLELCDENGDADQGRHLHRRARGALLRRYALQTGGYGVLHPIATV